MNEPEVQARRLPPASLESLEALRTEACTKASFRLQPFQLMMRRILSPDSPLRSMLLVHGTGTGKTCSAIQVAEEYILRPEFQDKRVIVLASEAVQGNFRKEIFDVDRMGQGQCTGSRYMDMMQRAQHKRLQYEVPEQRESMKKIVDKIVQEFYEFNAYISFANQVDDKFLTLRKPDFEQWVHDTFDNRLLIVDEAHNLRIKGERKEEEGKLIAVQLEKILKIAKGMTVVFLTATPMYDTFQEILYYFQLFLWNEKKEMPSIPIFTESGDFATPEAETVFRSWVHEYVSVIRGESPFSFPFRLPPPESRIAPLDRTEDVRGKKIKEARKYLPLVASIVQGKQKSALETIEDMDNIRNTAKTLCVSPTTKPLASCFRVSGGQYEYTVEPFLSPSKLKNVAAKFATVIDCIQNSEGIVFVYSNYVTLNAGGIEAFALALEEHGFENASGKQMLANPSGETTHKQGKYALLSSDLTPTELSRLLSRLRSPSNDIRVILASPLVSEGIDLKRIRQIHILDPWYNMSRMEQVIGRGLRTCSHAGLPVEEQNCTVYLHICRFEDSSRETFDEYIYREFVERKAKGIAKVKRVLMESAVDCRQQLAANELPEDWKMLRIPQKRAEGGETITLPLFQLSSPSFEDGTPALVCYADHPATPDMDVRPLSMYYDVRDTVLDTLSELFADKAVWKLEELESHPKIMVDKSVFHFLLHDAITNRVQLKDSAGRVGYLESRDGMVAFTPEDAPFGATFSERTLPMRVERRHPLEAEAPKAPKAAAAAKEEAPAAPAIDFPAGLSEETQQWILADQLSPDEKRKAIRENPEAPYAKGLFVGTMLVMGHEEYYDAEDNRIPNVVGAEKDALKAWTVEQMERVVRLLKDNRILASLKKDGRFVITGFDVKDGALIRSSRQKTIGAKVCGFYTVQQINVLLEALGTYAEGSRDRKCEVLGMFAHQSNPIMDWVQPEVWSVLNDNEEHRETLRKMLKE
jgi:hypothetical protein